MEALTSVHIIECSQPREYVEEDMVDNGLKHVTLLKEDTHSMSSWTYYHGEKQVRPVYGAWKIVWNVEVVGHCIYKSTLVLQLKSRFNHYVHGGLR